MRKIALLICLLPLLLSAQKSQIEGITVLRGGRSLQNPWVGGYNNPLFSPLDINQDGLMDLFVYDKAGWKPQAFINTGSTGALSYTYAPRYDYMFPRELRDWAVIRDYNRDGVGDIFALTSNSDIMVFKGYRTTYGLGYTKIYDRLNYTIPGFQADHIWTFMDNLPIMQDIDHDGDLDVLASDIAGGSTLNFYQNQAVEGGMNADSMVFVRVSNCWGHFIENSNDCGVTLASCKTDGLIVQPSQQGARHQGGALYGIHYRTHSPVVSLLLADIYCNTLKFLENRGDTSEADMIYADSIFPRYDRSVNLPLFPAPFGLDADNDGREDLFISPFASNAYQPGQSEDVKVVQYYHNIANDSLEKYHYVDDSTFMREIVDVGTESHPVFLDYDGDGLMDIVIGNYGRFQSSGASKSSLTLYHNIGTDTMPVYQEASSDWYGLSAYNVNGIFPAFGDMNGDGKPDMVVGDYTGKIHFFKNTSTTDTFKFPSLTQQNWFNISVTQNAAPFIYDVNGDSLPDLVIGSRSSNIQYYWNFGTRTNPLFSRDSVNTFFGGARVYDYHLGLLPGFAAPCIRQEGSQLVMYSGSQLGRVFKFLINRDSLRTGTFQLLDSDLIGISVGLRSTISIADINHDGQRDYLTGNIRGGMMLFSDAYWGNGAQVSVDEVPGAAATALQVYPNPARDRIVCRLAGAEDRLTYVELYDVLGHRVNADIAPGMAQEATISVAGLAAGAYVLHAADTQGHTYDQKVIIIK